MLAKMSGSMLKGGCLHEGCCWSHPSWAVLLCRFGAGDVVMMRPCNSPEDVQQFCQLLTLDPEASFTLRPTDNTTGVCVVKKATVWATSSSRGGRSSLCLSPQSQPGFLSPALCATWWRATWTLLLCPAVHSLRCCLRLRPMTWSRKSSLNSAHRRDSRNCTATATCPDAPRWRWGRSQCWATPQTLQLFWMVL